jgi:hypothetical protein
MTSTAQRCQQPEATQVALCCQQLRCSRRTTDLSPSPNLQNPVVSIRPAVLRSAPATWRSTVCTNTSFFSQSIGRLTAHLHTGRPNITVLLSDCRFAPNVQMLDGVVWRLMYEISHKSVKKCGQCIRKFVTVAAVCRETRVQATLRRKECPYRVSQTHVITADNYQPWSHVFVTASVRLSVTYNRSQRDGRTDAVCTQSVHF